MMDLVVVVFVVIFLLLFICAYQSVLFRINCACHECALFVDRLRIFMHGYRYYHVAMENKF